MVSQTSLPENIVSGQDPPSYPNVSVQQLVLRIDESRMKEVADRAKLLPTEDSQLVVNFLSKALEKNGVLSNNVDRALPLLAKIASSTNAFPTHRTLKTLHYEPMPVEPGGNIHYCEPGVRVKVVKQRGKEAAHNEGAITWAHLSHPNISPLYGVFFAKEENCICLASPWTDNGDISAHSQKLPLASRMSLISDVTNGLCYLHQLNIVHGGLNTRVVLVSKDGRAMIADFQDPGTSTVRYSAPEILKRRNSLPTIAADMWSFGCILYEILSGNVPFCQHDSEGLVGAAIERGEKSIRPGQEGVGGEKIDITMWDCVLKFWEINPRDRLDSLKFREILSSLGIQTGNSEAGPVRPPRQLELMEASTLDCERAQALLTQLLPSVLQIPKHIRRLLSSLICKKIEDIVAVKQKVCSSNSDTRALLDFLDLAMKQDILTLNERTRVQDLHSAIKISTLAGELKIEGGGPQAKDSPVNGNSRATSSPEIDIHRVEALLLHLQSELLQMSLSVTVLNHTKDVAVAVGGLPRSDVQSIVDFLDLVRLPVPSSFDTRLNPQQVHTTFSEESNRILAVLSRISSSTLIFPQRLQVKPVSYQSQSIAEGAYGSIHRGLSNPNLCVKVSTRIDFSASAAYIGELIVWAHASHPNVLPFYGIFPDESQGFCLVSPFMKNGNLQNYAPRLAQTHRWPLLLDIVEGLDYLHERGIVHGNLKGEDVLISDEGRALITDFGGSYVSTATAQGEASRVVRLRFAPPEMVSGMSVWEGKKGDIWSFGCLAYTVLSRKLPYYEYRLDFQVLAALVRGQLPKRPGPVDLDEDDDDSDGIDEHDWDDIDDPSWDVIMRCCTSQPEDRVSFSQIRDLIVCLRIRDDRPEGKGFHGSEIFNLRSKPEIDWDRVDKALGQIQVEVLQNPLSQLMRNHIKELRDHIAMLDPGDTRTLVNFLDVVLANHITAFKERNRLLALLSRTAVLARIFPQRYELETIQCQSQPFSREGTSADVYRGLLSPNLCIKVMKEIDDGGFIKELILSAHLSHPNILPFYGAFLDDSQHLCLVSPYMKSGNLGNYAFGLPQQSRVPLLSDIISGLEYLHNLGIVHSDLKPANALISDDGPAMIADHGASHVTTATAKENPRTRTRVDYTLCYMAPEIVMGGHRVRPTKEADIWSFGCLCYHVLSHKIPYFQYRSAALIQLAILRGEVPMRPVLETIDSTDETDGLSDDFVDVDDGLSDVSDQETDLEELNDELWDLIVRCCKPKPGDRSTISDIQKMIADMKIEDTRPKTKDAATDASIKHRFNPEVDLNRVGVLLTQIQAQFPPAKEKQDDVI